MEHIYIFDFDGTLTNSSLPSPLILRKCKVTEKLSNSKIIEMLKYKLAFHNELFCRTLFDAFLFALRLTNSDMTDEGLTKSVGDVTYNEGVESFLKRSLEEGNTNYLLSSDIQVFMERTQIAPYFEDIIGTTFNYNDNKEATSVDTLIYDTKKICAIKEILSINGINPLDTSRVVYFGDGLTDLHAMEYIKSHGGKTIFIENNDNYEFKKYVLSHDIASLSTKGDFSSDGLIDRFLHGSVPMRKVEFNNSIRLKKRVTS